MSTVRRSPNPTAAAEACGQEILSILELAIRFRSQGMLAVSGGSSPKPMFEFFARTPFAWDKVQLFWVDERCVPATDPESNFKLANDLWLAPAKFPERNIHRVRTELTPREAAHAYADEIDKCFGLKNDDMPRFDIIHRGMGPDGHTASLFPGEPLITDRRGLTAAVWVETMEQHRVTLLPGVLKAARNTVMLVTGADKALVLKDVLHGLYDPLKYPAQIAADQAIWFVDKAAAAQLPIES